MEDTRYKLIFTGKVQEGFHHEDVKKKTAELFKLPSSVVEMLFSGDEHVVKKRGSREVCERIMDVMDQAGAVCRIEPEIAFRLEPRLDHPYHQQRLRLASRQTPQGSVMVRMPSPA